MEGGRLAAWKSRRFGVQIRGAGADFPEVHIGPLRGEIQRTGGRRRRLRGRQGRIYGRKHLLRAAGSPLASRGRSGPHTRSGHYDRQRHAPDRERKPAPEGHPAQEFCPSRAGQAEAGRRGGPLHQHSDEGAWRHERHLGPHLRILPLQVCRSRRQAGRRILHACLHCAHAGRGASALQRPCVRPLLRVGRHVCAVGPIHRRTSGQPQRYLRLRAGQQPYDVENGADEPGHPRHRGRLGQVCRRHVLRRPAPHAESRLHPGQSAFQFERLGRRQAAGRPALALRHSALGQCQLCLVAAHDLSPLAPRPHRHGAGQRFALFAVGRRRQHPRKHHQGRPRGRYRGPALTAVLYDRHPRFAVVPEPQQEAAR